MDEGLAWGKRKQVRGVGGATSAGIGLAAQEDTGGVGGASWINIISLLEKRKKLSIF